MCVAAHILDARRPMSSRWPHAQSPERQTGCSLARTAASLRLGLGERAGGWWGLIVAGCPQLGGWDFP